MTTIGSTSYSTSAASNAVAEKANATDADSENGGTSAQQEAASETESAETNASQTIDGRPSTVTINLQGKLVTAHLLSATLKPINVSELPAEKYQDFIEGEERRRAALQQMLEHQYTQRPDRPALTQSQFAPIELQPTVDYEAMEKDPMYQMLQNMREQLEATKQMRAEFLAQQTDVSAA
jgi:hypothetical protein